MEYFEALRHRRSYYGLEATSPLSQEQLHALLLEAAEHAPSSFDSRSSRMILLLGEAHKRLWDIVWEVLSPRLSEQQQKTTRQKLNTFAAGYGSILFYEDQSVVQDLQKQFPRYQEQFPLWSEQSSGMLQYMVWTGLESEGLGASLQHYNPLIDEKVAEAFHAPAEWKLISQMPFGRPTAEPGPKKSGDVHSRVWVYKD